MPTSPVPTPWTPIEDLTSRERDLANQELAALGRFWEEQREGLEAQGVLARFTQRLVREFAVETGLLERLYSLDRGVTVTLIEHGIDAALIPHQGTNLDPHRVAALIRDQATAVEALFDFVAQRRALSTSFIKELHALLTQHQETTEGMDSLGRLTQTPLLRGEWKRLPNNPTRKDGSIHFYCPPEHVAAEMDRLVSLHNDHLRGGVPPEVEGAWLHHRFTQIHPFQDGNGRVARCLASLVFVRARLFPVVILSSDRDRYIADLEQADRHDLGALVGRFVESQRRALKQALSVSAQLEKSLVVGRIIQATAEKLQQQTKDKRTQWHQAEETARQLGEATLVRLEAIRQDLAAVLARSAPERTVRVSFEPPDGNRKHWFRRQVIETARALGYYANMGDFHSWGNLVLGGMPQTTILISCHTLGRDYRGILAISACLFQRTETEGERETGPATPLSDEIFQLNYVEPAESARERFAGWLEDALARGLELWRRSL